MHRALAGLSGAPRSWPATSAQKQTCTHGRIVAVRRSLQSSRGTPRKRSSRRCFASRGEERSVQGLLRAKEAETGSGGGGGFEVAAAAATVVPAAADAAGGVVAFLSAKKTLAEASGTASAIIIGRDPTRRVLPEKGRGQSASGVGADARMRAKGGQSRPRCQDRRKWNLNAAQREPGAFRSHIFFRSFASTLTGKRRRKKRNKMRALPRLSSSAGPCFGALVAAPGLSRAQRRVPSGGAVASSSAEKKKEAAVRSMSPSVSSRRCLSPSPSSLSRRRPLSLVARAFSDDEDEDYDDVELDGEGFFGVSL